MTEYIVPIVLLVALVGALVILPGAILGLTIIGERQVGVVVKRFSLSGRALKDGKLVALNGEAGYQADTLAPGWHLGYFSWMYQIHKVPVTIVPQGEIALISAAGWRVDSAGTPAGARTGPERPQRTAGRSAAAHRQGVGRL